MAWTGSQLAEFLKTELGPTWEAEGLTDDVGIFLATFSPKTGGAADYTSLIAPTLTDPGAVKYVRGVGLQNVGNRNPLWRWSGTGLRHGAWHPEQQWRGVKVNGVRCDRSLRLERLCTANGTWCSTKLG